MKVLLLLVWFTLTGVSTAQNSISRSAVFLAHSTGSHIWQQYPASTSVPNEIDKYNSAHSFSGDKKFSMIKVDFPTDPWVNEWSRWHKIFDEEDSTADIIPYTNNYGIVVIKSCFPSSALDRWGDASDTLEPKQKTVYNYKWHWRSFIKKMAIHKNTFFVVWTNAPLVAGQTDDTQAYLSDSFCTWAKDTLAAGLDPVFGDFPINVYVFDFFHKLAGSDGKLPLNLAVGETDSHPNYKATEIVAPQFVNEVFTAELQFERDLPVELVNFYSAVKNNQIHLYWNTATEKNNYGFEVERKIADKNGNENKWEQIGLVKGFGSSIYSKEYSFIDKNPPGEILYYRLKQIDYNGSFEYFYTIKVNFSNRYHYTLKQNYPNPFNPSTTIEYIIPEDTQVKIILYDITGNKLIVLKNEFMNAGQYKINLKPVDLSTGVYIYSLMTNSFKESKKMLYLK